MLQALTNIAKRVKTHQLLWAALFVVCGTTALASQPALAANPTTINFQGKVVNADGTNVANGTYTFIFRLYDTSSPTTSNSCLANGTCWWEETDSITVTNGVFQVELGSVCAFTSACNSSHSGIDFSVNNALYLTFKFNADAAGFMSPTVHLTSVPYAFNADAVDGMSASQFVQLTPASQQTGSIDVSSTVNSASGISTGGTSRIDSSGNLANIGNITHASGNITEKLGAANNTFAFQSSGSVAYLTVDTSSTSEVLIGSSTTDTTQILLQLDSYAAASGSVADTASCSTTVNQGALYYNTNSNAVRGCVNGNWEDMVSTGSLGLQLFGVVPDSGSTNPGDIAGVTGLTNGPCRAYQGASGVTVAWRSCVAFSGGRKVIVAAGSTTLTAGNNNWYHLCLTTANTSQPALSAGGAETLNLSTVSFPSTTAPILCLADVITNASAITAIYDTRTYTTTEKEFASVITTAPVLGQLVKIGSTTPGSVAPSTALQGTNVAGVIVAATGATSTNSINAIIATNGLAAVKAITGTNAVGDYIESSGTTGRAVTIANSTVVTADFALLGFARSAWTGATACTNSANTCAGSILTNINIR